MGRAGHDGSELGPLCDRMLELARSRLGMDIAWVSELTGDRQIMRALRGDHSRYGLEVGDESPLSSSYCVRVLDGRLPNAVPDARGFAETRGLPGTADLAIGAYVGVPVRVEGGRLYGMLCCVSHEAAPELSQRDVTFLELLAQLVGEQLERDGERRRDEGALRDRIAAAISGTGLTIVYQPIMSLATGAVAGCEALSRFGPEPGQPGQPARWFAEAGRVGLGPALERAAIVLALRGLAEIPEDTYLAVNASPGLLAAGELGDLLDGVDASRLVVEITEHAAVADYDALVAAIGALRGQGVRLAVDDAGAGFASMNHVLRLRPDIVKLDITLTRGIGADPVRRALAGALVEFARSMGASVVGEGVERQDDLDALVELGAGAAQGFLLARPGRLPLPAALPQPTSHRRQSPPGGLGAVVARAAASGGPMDEVVPPLLEGVLAVTSFDVAFLALRDGDAVRYEHVTGRLGAREWPAAGPGPAWADSLCVQCRDRNLLWTASVPADLPGVEVATRAGVQSFVSMPIELWDGTDAGSVCAAAGSRRYLDGAVVDQLFLAARLVADVLARRRGQQTVSEVAGAAAAFWAGSRR